jgi:uncharacterized protein with beta-barrel porin domain
MKSSRKVLLAGASILAIVASMAQPDVAYAQSCAISGGTITGSCISYTLNSSLPTLTNHGSISSGGGLQIGSGVTASNILVGTLINSPNASIPGSGVITGVSWGLYNLGSISTIINAGTISGENEGIWNDVNAHIDTLSIGATATVSSSSGTGLYNNGGIGALIVSGTLSGVTAGINNRGVIGAITNNGTIESGNGGFVIYAISGTIGPIANSGVIAGSILANQALTISGGAAGTVGTLTGWNGTLGSIQAPGIVFTSGNLLLDDGIGAGSGTVSNTGANVTLGGTISINGNYVQSGGSLVAGGAARLVIGGTTIGGTISGGGISISNGGAITDGGTITGNIWSPSQTLTIGSASGGTLTGGTISASNISFTSGNILLNDSVSGNVTNGGATISLGGSVSITGNYAQTGGTLSLGGGALTISGTTSLNVGTVVAEAASTGNYLAGGTTILVSGGVGSSYSGVTVASGLTGLAVSGNTSGSGNLTATYLNDYIGGTLSSLGNAGSIGAAFGVYVASTGSLGSLTNSGTISGTLGAIDNSGVIAGAITNSGVIAGNIFNGSSNPLTINGGTSGTIGTLTGYAARTAGSITGTSADLIFASGSLLLNDDINVGGHTVYNTGATLALANARAITGNYSQTGGGLVIGVASPSSYGALAVSGNATVTGSAITISGSGLMAGERFTIVKAGGAGIYNNDTASVSGTSGLSASLTTIDNALDVILSSGNGGGGFIPSTDYTAMGRGAGGAAAGMGPPLDAIAMSNTPAALAFQRNVLAPLNALPAWQQPSAMRQLAPLQITPAAQVANLAITPTTLAIETHQLAMGEGNAAGAAAGSAPHAYGLWGQVLGGVAQRNSDATTDGYQSSNFGLVSGLDVHVDADTTLGAALSWSRGWSWGEQAETGSFATVDSYQLTAYGQHYWGQVFVDGQVGVGYDSFNQRRAVGFIGNMAHATYDGQHYLAKLGGGYDIPVSGGVTLTPLAGLQSLRAVSGGYTETGSNDNLTVNRHGTESLTQDIGGKVAWTAATDWGSLTPEFRLAWVHDYVQGAITTTGTMVNNPSYASGTARPASDGARVNVAATLETVGDLSLRAEYEGEARQNYQSHTGMLKATWNF